MEYAHEELMSELEIGQNDLPSEIKKKVISFNRKRRMALKPESIAILSDVSNDIADEIAAWHYANSDDSEEDEEEEEIEREEPIHVEKPILEKGGSVVSHVENVEIQEEQKQIEKKNNGWGINLDW